MAVEAKGSDNLRTIPRAVFSGVTKMAAYSNKAYVCLFVTKYMKIFTVSISFHRSFIKIIASEFRK